MTQTPILEVRHLYKIFAPLDFRGEKENGLWAIGTWGYKTGCP